MNNKLLKKLEKEMNNSVTGTEVFYMQNKFYELIENGDFNEEEVEKMQEKSDLLTSLSAKYIRSDERNALYKNLLGDFLTS